jgi:hypothetical protein
MLENNLEIKNAVSITGDNTNTNSGAVSRGGENNVFARLKKGIHFSR